MLMGMKSPEQLSIESNLLQVLIVRMPYPSVDTNNGFGGPGFRKWIYYTK
jgi:hypothetical protein